MWAVGSVVCAEVCEEESVTEMRLGRWQRFCASVAVMVWMVDISMSDLSCGGDSTRLVFALLVSVNASSWVRLVMLIEW